MSYCSECGTKLEASMKFCGNCGHAIQLKEAPSTDVLGREDDSEAANSKVASFFQGLIFKSICWILCIIGILWGISSGSLTSSSIPSVGETVRFKLPQTTQRTSPSQYQKRELQRTNAYKRAKAAGRVP